MKSFVFKIKTITPTFMGGSNGRLDGIRATGIKGMMRWWFRALTGGIVGNDIKKLKNIEGNIFGIANNKSDSYKSGFKIIIESPNLKHLKTNRGFRYEGFTYLGIGGVLFEYDKDKQEFVLNSNKANLSGHVLIDAQSTFHLKFCFYPHLDNDDINLIVGSFYLATALGGFGLRARKCFGSWQITGDNNLDLKFDPNDYTEKGISRNINLLKEILKKKIGVGTPATLYPSIASSCFNFYVIPTMEANYLNLLNKFGKLYRGFRVCAEELKPKVFGRGVHTSDFDFLRGNLKAQDCDKTDFRNYKIRNALFGLNIIYPTLEKKSLQLERLKENGVSEKLRRASPVWFSIKEVNGNLTLFITLFKSQFKPEKSFVRFDGKEVEIEDYLFIEQKFIPHIKRKLERKDA